MSDPISFLRELIAINSVNPSLVAGGPGEKEIADAVAAEMREIGMDVEVIEVAPGRPNVIGIIDGKRPGPSLMFCGHVDTVGTAGMEAPFEPIERDGKLYGRGSGDMKGGVAAMIGAAGAVTACGGLKAGQLVVAAVVDEEYASIGAEALVKHWRADAAVVTEPTDLVVAIGHKGFSWIEIETRGRAAHGSRPLEGRDAILSMGRVLSLLERHDRKLQSRPAHPVLGAASLHASLINGGRELSTYPDSCILQLERRTITGETIETALLEVEEILSELRQEDPEFEGSARLLLDRPAYETPAEHPLPAILESSMQCTGYTTRRTGMTYWTDAAVLGSAGIPSVIFGPGGEGYHGLEEHVRIDEVLACRDALAELVRQFCV